MSTKQLLQLALLTALALCLQLLERSLELPLLFPGFKLGLANIVSLYLLIVMGLLPALGVTLLRVCLSSLISGTLFAHGFFLAIAGGISDCLLMYVAQSQNYFRFSYYGLSIIGATSHNLAQLSVASYLLSTNFVYYYLPYMLVISVPTGLLTGLLLSRLLRQLPLAYQHQSSN